MARTAEEVAATARFSRTYALGRSELVRSIERCVCGCDYGGTSWTTRGEADQVVSMLQLQPGQRLLDVGAGAGWPGLYLAGRMGCDVALTDLPLEGLRIARERAAAEPLSGTCWAAVADGAALPFRDGAFDGVYHSDVLCCLVDKASVLGACRRAVAGNGRMVFSVIFIAPDCPAADRQRAEACGPPFVATGTPYDALLRGGGWDVTACVDLTADYLQAMRKYVLCLEEQGGAIADLYGRDEADQMLARRRACVIAIEQGLLCRALFSAVPVGGGAPRMRPGL